MLIVALIVFQVVIFGVLIFFFRKIMTQNVVVATRHLEELNSSYMEKEKEAQRRLEEAERQAREIVTKAELEAEKLKVDILKHAEEEKERITSQAREQAEGIVQQADKSRQQLLAELEERITKGAISKACELIENTLPEQFKQQAHQHWVEDLIAGEFLDLKRLRLPEDTGSLRVVSAFELSPAQRKSLNKRLQDSLGRDVLLEEAVDPSIVAGIIVYIGDLVLDGSLKNKIKEKARG